MGRSPCCDNDSGVKKGPWTPEEDEKLIDHINKNGHGNWGTLPKHAGLNRCGKSCRLRWTNYLRPDIKRGKFTEEEERIIINLHSVLGNKWSKIAAHLPGRTDNEIKNFWNTHIRKKLLKMGIDPETHKPRTDINHLMTLSQLLGMSNMGNANWGNNINPLGDITQLAKLQLMQNLLQIMGSTNNSFVNMGSNPYNLSANPSLNPFNVFTNTHQAKEPMVLSGTEEYANHGLCSQAQSGSPSQQDVSKSWADIVEGAYNPQDHLDHHNKISSSNTSYENQEEKSLPALVEGTFNQIDSGYKTAQTSTESPSNTNFDDWEKFLIDDETSGSYWKELLDLTSTSASPISW